MKSFKTWYILGITAVLVIVIMIIQSSVISRTVDFSGTVIDISISETGDATLYAYDAFGNDCLFYIDEHSILLDYNNQPITIDRLDENTKIVLNYRKTLFKEESVYRVIYLKII